MHFNTETAILDPETGKQIFDKDRQEDDKTGKVKMVDGKPWTVGRIIRNTLLAVRIPEEKLSEDQAYERWALAKRVDDAIAKGEPCDLSIKEAAMILKLVHHGQSLLVYGQIRDVLEPACEPERRRPNGKDRDVRARA